MRSMVDGERPKRFGIRPATCADLPAVRAVLLAVRKEFGVIDETDTSDDDLGRLEEAYLRHRGAFELVVDEESQQIVGCAALRPLSPQRAELCKMYILASARGQGLGKRLLEALLALARQNGFSEVWLETNSTLTAAKSLYARYGFQPVDGHELLPRCDEAYLLRLRD